MPDMPQQINLCIAAFAPRRQRFQARFLLSLLGASLAMVAVLGSAWLWSLEQSAQDYRKTLDAQAADIKNLQAAIERSRSSSGPPEPALLRDLQNRRSSVQERMQTVQALRQGLLKAGQGHSDRLLALSRSIPADVWITTLRADGGLFDVSGYTLEPQSLNTWVAQLGQQPMLQGLQLNTVKVNYVNEAALGGAPDSPAPAASAGSSRRPPMWSFHLLSQAAPATVADAATPGAKP